MKIACNYYPETEQLFDEGKIELDYFKYPGLPFQMKIMEDTDAFRQFCDRVTGKRPILLHGLYPAPHDLSSPSLQTDFNDAVAGELICMTKTPGLSFHPALTQLPADVPFEQVFQTIVSNARFLKEKYSNMEFVALENCDTPIWGDLLKPTVITRLIDESGCAFLLDISHAFCASQWLGMPFFEYLKQLPLSKTIEIHINGWVIAQDDIMCHTKINDEGYRALEFVLGYCQPEIITLEYGRHNDRIGAGVPVLSPETINAPAMAEIEEQIHKLREICTK